MRRMVRGERSSFGQVNGALSGTSASCRQVAQPVRVRQPGNAAAARAAGAFRFNLENPAGHRHGTSSDARASGGAFTSYALAPTCAIHGLFVQLLASRQTITVGKFRY